MRPIRDRIPTSSRVASFRSIFVPLLLCLPFAINASATESDGASMNEIILGVQKLCGGSGSGVDFTVSGNAAVAASKAVAIVVNGKISGSAVFSKSEWDGVRAVRDDAKSYTQCVQSLTPTFIDKFAKQKKVEVPQYTVTIRSSTRFIDNGRFGQVDGSISDIELRIDDKAVVKADLDRPFGSHNLKLNAGEHTFEFIGSIYGAGSNGAILKDNCAGTFDINQSTTLQPRIKIERRGDDGVIVDCSLR